VSAFQAKRADVHKASDSNEHHVRIIVYAGKDAKHLQFAGAVVLRESEVEEFLARVNTEGNEGAQDQD
jgi:hypothetical protein